MTCRHGPGDTSCSSHPDNIYNPDNIRARAKELEEEKRQKRQKEQAVKDKIAKELYVMTPDSEKYEIVDVIRIGSNLVMKVQYPNCSKCSYEGNKVMVFLNVTEAQVLRWRKIDPHFREPSPLSPRESPGPAARFPASKEGWDDAVNYATSKVK